MASPIAVVTGANRGLGLAIVRTLLKEKPDWTVALTSRDSAKGQQAVEDLKKEGFKNVVYHQLDVTNKDSISAFKKVVSEKYPQGLTALVNNAGIFLTGKTENWEYQQSRFQQTCEVNYLSVFNVINELSNVLAKNARVAMISSRSAQMCFMQFPKDVQAKWKSVKSFDELNNLVMNDFCQQKPNESNQMPSVFLGDLNMRAPGLGAHLGDLLPYTVSKLALNVLAQLFQAKFDKEGRSDVLVNACTPGVINTDMNRSASKTAEEGAQVPVFLCSLPNGSQVRGAFVDADKNVVDSFTVPMPPQPPAKQ